MTVRQGYAPESSFAGREPARRHAPAGREDAVSGRQPACVCSGLRPCLLHFGLLSPMGKAQVYRDLGITSRYGASHG